MAVTARRFARSVDGVDGCADGRFFRNGRSVGLRDWRAVARRPGPAPKSADVIALTGNRGKLSAAEIEARRAAEIKATPLRSDPPEGLSTHARTAWKELAPELERLKLLTVLDSPSFFLACESYAIARSALEAMRPRRRDGEIDQRAKNTLALIEVDHAHGGQTRKVPAATVFFQASREFRSWCAEFGITPSSRLKLRPAAGATPAGGGSSDGEGEGPGFEFGY